MYFIPRNNAFYNYIAHTNSKRRYCATLFVVIMLSVVSFYGLYKPLIAHITLLKVEFARLQKHSQDGEQLKKSNKDFSISMDSKKKNISEHIITDDKKEEECYKRMQFVLDSMAKAGLVLNSYASCNEKDKKWYTKDFSHLQAIGSMEQILFFLKTIKDSDQMITLSHLAITRVKENNFQLSCDVAIILVKK